MRVAIGSLGMLCLLSCGPAPRAEAPPRAPAKPPTSAADSFDGVKPAQYRLIPLRSGSRRVGELSDEQRLIAGRRVVDRGGSVQLADSVGAPDLVDGRELPAFAGGGFLFWSQRGLYRSRTFTGRLEPLSALSFNVAQVSFGPGFVLLRGHDGSMLALDGKTGRARAPAPPGLVDVAAAADGRVVLALELGRFSVSVDRGATFREVQDELGQPVQSLSAEPLGFVLQDGAIVTLSTQGELTNRGVPARSKPSPPWPGGESALEQAVAFGVRRGTHALVAQSAALVEVDLQSGKTVRTGPPLLPGAPKCELFEQGSELLMKCSTREALSILGQLESERPVLEQTFESTAQLVSGFEHLLVNRDCNGGQRPYTVCVRERGGSWRTVSAPESPPEAAKVAATPSARPAREPLELGYGFKADGHPVSFVRRGDKSGYRDLVSDRFVELKTEVSTGGPAETACRVEENGHVRCLGTTGPQQYGSDGSLQASPLGFSWIAKAGERALGFDPSGKLFQTEDWGRTWVAVAPPPQLTQRIDRSAQCGSAGCRLGGWLRLGWEQVPPEAHREPLVIAAPSLAERHRPVLTCAAQAEPRLVTARLPADASELRGFGVEGVAGDRFAMSLEMTAPLQTALGSMAQRGIIIGKRPLAAGSESYWLSSESLRLRFVEFFDTTASKRSASLSMAEWLRSVRLAGSSVPSFAFEDQLSFQGVPVLSAEPGKAMGMVMMLEQTPVWLTNGRAQPLALERAEGSEQVLGAVAEKGGALVVLLDDGSVVRYAQGATVKLFQMPADLGTASSHATPDALAVTPQGDVAVLRFSGGPDAPSASYPVLAYRPGKPPELLAPFASVVAAAEPACAGAAGYRAIVVGNQGWLKVARGPGVSREDEWGQSMLVRWSAERVCVEALEIADSSFAVGEESLYTRIAATFGAKPSASRQGFAPGIELLQPLSCQLERAR